METQSEVKEQQVIVTGKRRRSSDGDMATAALSTHQESDVVVSYRTTRSGCSKKALSSRKSMRTGYSGCILMNKRIVSRHVHVEHAESSVVNSSPSPEGNQTPSPPVEETSSPPIGGASTTEAAMATRSREDTTQDTPLIPGLSDQLALHILALVPMSCHQPLKLVSKRWKKSLSNSTGTVSEVLETRKVLGLVEHWVFMLASGGQQIQAQWRAFDPVHNKWRWLPQCPCDYTFDSCDKESAVAGTQLLVSGHGLAGPTIWRYDLHTNDWSKAPRMIQSRCLFASASFGKYAYFAGGSSEGTVLTSAERYDSFTQQWEKLPDLHVGRRWCSGCILDGKFFVIGGQGGQGRDSYPVTSGEYYDEAEERWVVVDNMWPAAVSQPPGTTAPPLVAVVDNELYSADASTMELNAYHKGTNTWRPLGPVPYRSVDSSGWGMGFKAVGKEIFVIGGSSDRGTGIFCDMIHAWPPVQIQGEEVWRQVCQLSNSSGFIYNCAVMNV